ncbi:MAG: neutral/alkaline non-lysosomal ceramidase N-terminal domain-containing protein [Gammaproteobacteria bacterium]
MFRRLRRWLIIVVVAIPVLFVIGGAVASWPLWLLPTTEITVTRTAPLPAADTGHFEAGVAIRDITPPIGLPKFGYSALAASSDGFRTRLRARAFCLKPATGAPVVILQADLGASSALLQQRIAEIVAAKTDVPAHQLALVATHTHSGPAQYLDSNFYNTFGANRPGFDPKVFDFLATRMADAVIVACNNRRPARIGIGQATVWGLTRNRSLEAWVENHNVADKRVGEDRALEAVNPTMTLVRIDVRHDDGRWLPAGAFTTFSIHGTGIPAFRGPWHGDVWAAFEQEVEWAIRARYNPPWVVAHATFQATHGDNNPHWREGWRGDTETTRIGKELADVAWRIFVSLENNMREDAALSAAMREVNLLGGPAEDRFPLCDRAIIGAATLGAANGDEVFPIAYLPLLQEGWPRRWFKDGCHAEKQWTLSALQPLFMPADAFPHRALLQVLRINELALVMLPWEVTWEAGNRIAKRVEASLAENNAPGRVVVASHANGYLGYATTPEEYAVQYYEGGHTLYGPGTTEFLARQSARLAADLATATAGTVADLPDAWHYRLRTRSYWPEPVEPTGERALIEGPRFVPGNGAQEPYWSVTYRDVAPGSIDLHQPLLSVEALRGETEWVALLQNSRPVNDMWHKDLQIRWLANEEKGMARYELRWNNPPVSPNFRFRFAVRSRAGLPDWQSPQFPP